MNVLISGASIAGPALAYWLSRYGLRPTVVERAPEPRKTGGHAVDLFAPAMDVVERMGLLARVRERHTGTALLTTVRADTGRRADLPLDRLIGAISDRHVEIMREDLSELLHAATRDDVEYVFGDSIASLTEDPGGVEVTFERGAPRRFDLVIGADGLHSNVRRLVFGPEHRFTAHLGAYFAVLSLPDRLVRPGQALAFTDAGRIAALYGVRRTGDARAVFLFHSPPLDYHHRDTARQKELLRQAYAGMGGQVPHLLDELDGPGAFYFDSITQLRLDSWSRGRVSLVGDAGYCPGPAVGGSTSLAVVGAYVLAGELAAAGGDHRRGFAAYERELAEYVRRSRELAVRAARNLIPATPARLRTAFQVTRLLGALPAGLARPLLRLGAGVARPHDAVTLQDYGDVPAQAGTGEL